tara:strand:- start:38 stop:304 length:267 start_codon:yes stop_codon:yes gene_type:complete
MCTGLREMATSTLRAGNRSWSFFSCANTDARMTAVPFSFTSTWNRASKHHEGGVTVAVQELCERTTAISHTATRACERVADLHVGGIV